MKVQRIEISGLVIVGQNGNITYEEAMENRISKQDEKFIGRGILSWKEGSSIKETLFWFNVYMLSSFHSFAFKYPP